MGDERPELVCTRDGFFGYATIDPDQPFGEWPFHAISEKVAPIPFGHGLGVGDVNGDGRMDVLMKDGWFEQPESLDKSPGGPSTPSPSPPSAARICSPTTWTATATTT